MSIERHRIVLSGTVQGVGMRPYLHRRAHRLGLTGSTGNDGHGAWCEIQGPADRLATFASGLAIEAPPLARIVDIETTLLVPLKDERLFGIVESTNGSGALSAAIPPDVAPCPHCMNDVNDKTDRRYGYAFTCCTDCGPRFTVVRSLPYDRERTSMREFELCVDCAGEYGSPGDRRHHAQATCCPACGPTLELRMANGDVVGVETDPLNDAAALIGRGRIVAIKGVGGYQLVCRADDHDAVGRLREMKHRDEKPFAILTRDCDTADAIVELDDVSRRALGGPEAPIVLATRRAAATIASNVAPDTRQLGVMLPASPLHQLLCRATGTDLVCTSGNPSNEPIVTDDAEAVARLGGVADALLTHDRAIERHADDSVGNSILGRFQLLRRARGFAPRPVRLNGGGPTVLGVGAELKNTVCLAADSDAHVSVHLGDLEHPRTLRLFERTIADLIATTRATPELIVHDLHPEYLSTKFAAAQTLAPTLGVQHHHAHLASCLADNQADGPAIGVTFDGLGWGLDETMWGGEFLVGDARSFERGAHLRTVAMPGGSAAIREPWRMAVAHLAALGHGIPPLAVIDRHRDDLDRVVVLCDARDTVATSSIGRLFDAVAALCDLADRITYEGQAAIRLEQAATDTSQRYEWRLDTAGQAVVADPASLLDSIVDDLMGRVPVGVVAGSFHRAVAELVVDTCVVLRERTGIGQVALTGGVFQNRLLVELVVPLLGDRGFTTLRHSQVPPNDGGISLGQVAVGRAHLGSGVQ